MLLFASLLFTPLNVHIYPSTFSNESRILKVVQSLRQRAVFKEIRIFAIWKDGLSKHERLDDGIEVFRIAPLFGGRLKGRVGQLFKAAGWYIGVLLALRGVGVTCFNCHSLPVLPLASLIKAWKSCVLVYDPHELETETAGLRGVRRWIARKLERTLIRYADAVCVVNTSIADWYQSSYGLPKVWVIRNVPHRSDAAPVRSGILRGNLGLDAKAWVFLYQGLLAPGRGIRVLIEAFSRLPSDKHLVFMGYGELEDTVKAAARVHSNIHFHPAVPPQEVKAYTPDADVGLSLIENVCLSYYLCLPNKLFEYGACGVPAVVSAFPEMSALVDEYDCGWKLSPQSQELYDFVRRLRAEDLASKQENARELGRHYCWQAEEVSLLAMYASLGFCSGDGKVAA